MTTDRFTQEQFEAALRKLMEQYKVKLIGWADYNGNDEYIGTNYYFKGPGWRMEIKELEDDDREV